MQIRNLVIVAVRPSFPPFMTLTNQHCGYRCAITSIVQVSRPTPGRFHSGAPLLEESCALCPRTPSFNPLCRLLDAPSSACSTVVHPLSLKGHSDTPSVFYAERALLCNIQARGRYFLKQHERNARSNGGNRPRLCSDWGEHGCPKVELARVLDIPQGSSTKDCAPG